jgi:hypothetical protein
MSAPTTTQGDCPCDTPQVSLAQIPAGLSSIPRQTETQRQVSFVLEGDTQVASTIPPQTQTFPDVREALLAGIPNKVALANWRARGQRDFGLMWLEMWAYVADVLGFYDERISNESYIRTAVQRSSLRRLVEMLGYVPAPGVAGSATLAAIADGKIAVTVTGVPQGALAGGTAFRSTATANGPPQIYELAMDTSIHPLQNSWTIDSVPLTSLQTNVFGGQQGAPSLTFETRDFAATKGRFLFFPTNGPLPFGDVPGQVATVTDATPFEGRDLVTYIAVKTDNALFLPTNLPTDQIVVQTPQVRAALINHKLLDTSETSTDSATIVRTTVGNVQATQLDLDTVYRQLHVGDNLLIQGPPNNVLSTGAPPTPVTNSYTVVLVNEIASVQNTSVTPNTIVPAHTQITVVPAVPGDGGATSSVPAGSVQDESLFSLYFNFVNAGHITAVAATAATAGDLTSPGPSGAGVQVTGVIQPPPAAVPDGNGNLVLTQQFLLSDADTTGALVTGTMTFKTDVMATGPSAANGTAFFLARPQQGETLPDPLKAPITIYGNLLQTSRGQSVINEILGSGIGTTTNQQFTLQKSPLTYLPDISVTPQAARSTLQIRVNQVLWSEVTSFFDAGPTDQVYIVRFDDQQNTTITFGDGVHGARLPSGVNNVVAAYRFGSGADAPLAGGIRQLAKAFKGLRRVESPIAAIAGRDPDGPDTLRTSAPKSVLLFGHPVSAPDFEVLANLAPGVTKAVAEFLFIDTTKGAGIVITYIGSALPQDIVGPLQAQAEPGLAIVAKPAVAVTTFFTIEVEVNSAYNPATVATNVTNALLDPVTGILAEINAPIGRPIYRSAIFDVVQQVAGVTDIISASGDVFGQILPDGSTTDFFFDFQLAATNLICAGIGGFLDFGVNGANVTVNAVFTSAAGTSGA